MDESVQRDLAIIGLFIVLLLKIFGYLKYPSPLGGLFEFIFFIAIVLGFIFIVIESIKYNRKKRKN